MERAYTLGPKRKTPSEKSPDMVEDILIRMTCSKQPLFLWCCRPFSAPPTPRKIIWCWLCLCKRLWKGLWAMWDKAGGQRTAAAEVGRVQAGATDAEEAARAAKTGDFYLQQSPCLPSSSPAALIGEIPSPYLVQPSQRAQGHQQGSVCDFHRPSLGLQEQSR